jgi:hypothetical protein
LGLLRPALPALSGVSLGVFAVLLAIDASGSGNRADDSDGVAYGPPAAGMRDLAAESQPAADEAMAAPPEQDAVGRAAAATAPATTPLGFAADGTPQPAGAAVTQGDDAELPAPTAPTVPPPAGASTGENKAATAPPVAPSTGQEQVRATGAGDEDSGVDALWIAEIAALIVAAAAGVGAFVIWSRRESG